MVLEVSGGEEGGGNGLTAKGVCADVETGQGGHSGDIKQWAGAVCQFGILPLSLLWVLTN